MVMNNVQKIASPGLEGLADQAIKIRYLYICTYLVALVFLIIGIFWTPALYICLALLILSFVVYFAVRVKLTGDDSSPSKDKYFTPVKEIAKSEKIFIVDPKSIKYEYKDDPKYRLVASSMGEKRACVKTEKAPFPFKVEGDGVILRAAKTTFMFLADKLVVADGKNVAAMKYEDLIFSFSRLNYTDTDGVPSDMEVTDYYQDDETKPIYPYGRLSITSEQGMNTAIVYSNGTIPLTLSAE